MIAGGRAWKGTVVLCLLAAVLVGSGPAPQAAALAVDRPVVGMASTPDGRGYWLVAADGGIFGFGDAAFYGSTGGIHLNQPVVGMASTPDGRGYWLVAADGGIFGFGDAAFSGSTGGTDLSRPIVGMASEPDGRGYWLAASDGGLFAFGTAGFYGSVPGLPPSGPPRIALYGDSLASEAGQDFAYLAGAAGAPVLIRTFPGVAICDDLATMAADARSWHPTVAVLAFSGDAFTPCMAGYPLGSPAYFAKYVKDAETAVAIFGSVGARVVLVGLPLDASAGGSRNVTTLNHNYESLATGNGDVTYDDAGQAVLAAGRFTRTLPCLPFEPCTGPAGTNIVRAPDGVHFCPTGRATLVGYFEECDVYSSGAFRFASAMLGPALAPPGP